MDNETLKQVEFIFDCIKHYMNGEEEYEESIIEIIKGLKKYSKAAKSNEIKTKILFIISSFATFICAPGLKNESLYQEVMNYAKEDFEYYLSGVEGLKRYLEQCFKYNKYPDLDMAYLLSIKLSLLYRDIMDYFGYIREMEKAINNNKYYLLNVNYRKSIINNKEEIKKLLLITDNEVFEEKED